MSTESVHTDHLLVADHPDEHPFAGADWPRSAAFWMAALYLGLFIIRPWEKLVPALQAFNFERLYVMLMLATVVLGGWVEFRVSLQTATVLLYLGAVGLSSVLALDPSLATNDLYFCFTLCVFYFVLNWVIRSPQQLAVMIGCYIAFMAVYLGKSQWEYFLYGNYDFKQGVKRLMGIEYTYGAPNELAASVVYSLPMLVFLYNVRHAIGERWSKGLRGLYLWGLAAYLVLAVSSILLTNSRSGMVRVILVVFLIAMRGRGFGRKLAYILCGVAVLACLWLVMPEDKKGRFMTMIDPSSGPDLAQSSAEGRIFGFQAGMEAFQRFPVTGVGVGNFLSYRIAELDGKELQTHNLIGQLLAETGMLGGLAFAAMAGVTLFNSRQTRLRAGDDDRGDPARRLLREFAPAARDSIILLFVGGFAGNNEDQYNWYWVAAFADLSARFARRLHESAGLRQPCEDELDGEGEAASRDVHVPGIEAGSLP